MSGLIEVLCSRCDGTGDTICCIFNGRVHRVRCQWCHGTGWVPVATLPGWAQARADLIQAEQLRQHEAGIAADQAYQAFAGEEALR